MEGYEEKTSLVTVPKNTGIEGFLRAVRGVLALPFVQGIQIDAKGALRYTRYVKAGESEAPLAVNYEGLDPWSIIRNGVLEEITHEPGDSATSIIAYMFDFIAREGLVPTAFASGAGSHFWQWHSVTAGVELGRKTTAYGLPFLTDRQMPDHSLVLCAAYIRGGSLVDCHRFLMTGMTTGERVPPATGVTL